MKQVILTILLMRHLNINIMSRFIKLTCLCLLCVATVACGPKVPDTKMVNFESEKESFAETASKELHNKNTESTITVENTTLIETEGPDHLNVPTEMSIDGVVYWENPEHYLGFDSDWEPTLDSYSREKAIEKGCVIVEMFTYNGIVYGNDIWKDFCQKSRQGIPCVVHIVNEFHDIPKEYKETPELTNMELDLVSYVDVIYDGEYYYGIQYVYYEYGNPQLDPIVKFKYLNLTSEDRGQWTYTMERACLTPYETLTYDDYLDHRYVSIDNKNYDVFEIFAYKKRK